jgi:UDP-N-acetylglucosamine--dolichyl-phosphate N-acetylglucosaminephosphotransferase
LLDTLSEVGIAIVFAVAGILTFVSTPILGRILKRRGIVGRDVHKLLKIELPEMCGLAILLGLTVGVATSILFFPDGIKEAAAFIGTVLIAGAIGFVDDLRPLAARIKPLLTAGACLPILLLRTYDPNPMVPLLGPVRLTLVYPLLIPIAIAVTSNGVNMMDVMNGSMPGTVSVVCGAATVILLASGNVVVASFSVGLLGALVAFYYFNRFPAKVLDGDTGSLAVGSALAALAILGRIEAVMIVALIPHIMNAFYGLASVGRLYERREIRQRPIRLLEDGRLEASADKNAPITLTRLILASGPMTEKGIVRGMIFLTLVSSTLAILTFWIMMGR